MSTKAKKVEKKETTKREILGVKLSEKPSKELLATIEVIKNNKGKVNVPFDKLFSQFIVELRKLGSKSNSNLKTRFRRCLYRNVESILTKNSIQSAKFNLKANIKGITIKTKSPIEFKNNQDAITSTVDNNFYSFKVAQKIDVIKERKISKALLEKIAKLKEA